MFLGSLLLYAESCGSHLLGVSYENVWSEFCVMNFSCTYSKTWQAERPLSEIRESFSNNLWNLDSLQIHDVISYFLFTKDCGNWRNAKQRPLFFNLLLVIETALNTNQEWQKKKLIFFLSIFRYQNRILSDSSPDNTENEFF